MTNKEIAEIVQKSDVYLPRIFWLAFHGWSSFQEFVDFLDEMTIEDMKRLSPEFELYIQDTFGKTVEELEDPQQEFENHFGMTNKFGFLAEVRMPRTTKHEFEDVPKGATVEGGELAITDMIVDGKRLVGFAYQDHPEHSSFIYGEDHEGLLSAMDDFQRRVIREDIELEKRNN